MEVLSQDLFVFNHELETYVTADCGIKDQSDYLFKSLK